MTGYPGTKSKINLPIAIFLIGLVLFVVGVCWYLRVYIIYLYELEIEITNQENAIFQGIYWIGLASIIFGVTSFLYKHTLKLVPLRNPGFYRMIIILSYMISLTLEIVSHTMLYFAFEDLGNGDSIRQFYWARLVETVAEIGMIVMLLMIFMFILKIHNLDRFQIIPPPPGME
jgi:hypothetical protein